MTAPFESAADSSVDPSDLDALQDRIGYRFNNSELLIVALTHRSYAAEHLGVPTNERLEFLGDAVLGWAIADLCFDDFPDYGEGKLTSLRKSVVNASALAELARTLGIGPLVRLGRGELAAGGGDKPSILSDAIEALIGAMYTDGGAGEAKRFIRERFTERLHAVQHRLARVDEKSALQEITARLGAEPPIYQLTSSGPDHDKHFVATVAAAGVSAIGEGRSKKTSQQSAAAAAVQQILALHTELVEDFGGYDGA